MLSHLEDSLKTEIQCWFSNRIERRTKNSIRGGDCDDYVYDDHYDIQHTGQLQQQTTNSGHSKNWYHFLQSSLCKDIS